MTERKQYGADLVVDSLINHDVEYVFGIPGAKIDRVFDTLEDKGPKLIVARHEKMQPLWRKVSDVSQVIQVL